MAKFVKIDPNQLKELHNVDKRLVSYNVEMTEVTGGTFWKAYTPAQVDGTEEFPPIPDWRDMSKLQQWYDPIDLYNPRLRKMAKELGTAWVRVSGTWANKTYYDFDGHTGGKVPEGFENLLTKEQWVGVLDFVKYINGKLLVSVANCPGIHDAATPWDQAADQAKLLFDFSRDYGVPIDAAEFTNEPNMIELSGLPVGYTAADYARDQNLFAQWLRKNYPGTLYVGPCSTDGDPEGKTGDSGAGLGIGFNIAHTPDLMGPNPEPLDVYSYHYYNGISERGAAMGGHWEAGQTLTEEYLAVAGHTARINSPVRDRYCPGGQMWVTESGDAGCGGNTWASTYMDVPRTLNELGEFSAITDGVIFHNTLASSDYGYLQHGTFEPRPNYFAALLWNRLMGETVYDAGPVSEGAHVFAHSRKDGKEGTAWLVINNSLTESTTVELPQEAEQYTLSGEGKIRSRVMLLNGKQLVLGENDALPAMEPVKQPAGKVELAPGTCTFFIL